MVRGQMKIQQMAFMLIAVVLFFVLIGMAILTIGLTGIKKSATSLEEENVKLLVSKLANSPEFSCGNSFTYSRTNCIDYDKILELKENKKYDNFWGIEDIEIIKIYPESLDIECEKNIENCNRITIKTSDQKSKRYISNFVSLCKKDFFNNEVYDKCEIAKLSISYGVEQ